MVGKFGSFERFDAEVKKFAKDLNEKDLVIFHKSISFEAFKRIIQKTPVDTGRARGNWQLTIGAPSEKIISDEASFENLIAEFLGGSEFDKALGPLGELKPFQVVYISNNVPYIIFLEDGTSDQAPAGMVALTFEELLQAFPGTI